MLRNVFGHVVGCTEGCERFGGLRTLDETQKWVQTIDNEKGGSKTRVEVQKRVKAFGIECRG
jgi:hypothetical protein